MEKEEYENISIMFNLRKNEFLSGNVALKVAEYSNESKLKEANCIPSLILNLTRGDQKIFFDGK